MLRHSISTRTLRRPAGLMLLAVVALGGACAPRMKVLSDREYAPLPGTQIIFLYPGNVETPHEELAIIDTKTVDQLTTDTNKALLEDLRARARRLGANAVTHVQMLTVPERGWIVDPQTPFHSWRQGWNDLYMLRGRAIRFRPLTSETGEGDVSTPQLDFAGDEKPTMNKPPAQPNLELYRTRDKEGRVGWGSRKPQPGPKLPTLETGG